MTFHWPHAFWFLLVPVALALLDLRKRRAAGALTHPKIIRAQAGARHLTVDASSLRHAGPRLRWRLWLGLILATGAFARPQWGRLDEPVFDQSRDIIIALDLSRSMQAEDIRPSRLDRAKLLVSSLLERLAGERVGLVVFSGTAFLQAPLSTDYEILREFLPSLNPAFLPQGGTNYEALIQTSLDAFASGADADRYLIVLSDGEATDEGWKPLATELKKKNVRVISLGVGTTGGAMIPDGAGAFVKDERGAVVLSKLESSTLQELASQTNGVYSDASTWVDLAQLIDSTVAAGKKGDFQSRNRVRFVERFQWALAPAILILLWGFWREFPVRPRLRDVKLDPTEKPSLAKEPGIPPASSTGGLASAAALIVLLALASTEPAHAAPAAKDAPANDALGSLVAQLAARDTLTPSDYASLARATVSYGQRLKEARQGIPEGPVRDALAAVEAGTRLDSKAADWAGLRRDLEALLQKDEPPKEDQKNPPPQQQQNQKQQDQQQKQKEQNKDSKSEQQDSQQQQNKQQQQQQEQQQRQKEGQSEQQKPSEPKNDSAFGDMKNRSAQPTPEPPKPADPTEMQRVGGAPEKKPASESKDPSLALPLQKLEQLKSQDSPAVLQQLLQGQEPSPATKGKDW